jgi:OOP family OmpA-OmpF porin
MPPTRPLPSPRALTVLLLACALALPAAAQLRGERAVRLGSAASEPSKTGGVERSTSLPARGLFVGEQLSEYAKVRLTDFILNALGLQIEAALVVPTGPWNLDGSGKDERDLTPARLAAVKRFLQERGVDPKRIYVESRIDEKIKEPRLDLQILGRPAAD